MNKLKVTLVSALLFLLASTAFAEAAKEALVELAGQWYPATVAEEKENLGVKAYRIVYTASGGQEWVAPNRILFDKNATKPTVGQTGGLPSTMTAGAAVSVEYNGGWYPAKLDEITSLAGTPIYKITYTQSGLVEYVAGNRIKSAS